MKRIIRFSVVSLPALLAISCTRVNYETVRTPTASVTKTKTLLFPIDSQPQGASTYVDSINVGPTPVTVQAGYDCNEVTYKNDTVTKVRNAGLDITAGAILLGGGLMFLAFNGIPSIPPEGMAATSVIGVGLSIPGLALLIRGSVLKKKNGKIKSSEMQTVEECPARVWKLVLAKEGHLPAERILKTSDEGKTSLVVLSPATMMGGGALPPAAVDKSALLSSMAAKTETLTGSDKTVAGDAKMAVQERMKSIPEAVSFGEGFESAGDDLFITLEAGDTKMFEMTTEKGYCYAITSVAQAGNPVYLAVFRDGKEIVKDFMGSDMASVSFCSTSSDPVRVTLYSVNASVAGLRIYYQAK
jgi:hypothetical protein